MTKKHLAFGLFLLLVLLAAYYFYSHFRAAAHPIDLAQRGRALYIEKCASCHGLQGKGGIGRPLNDRKVLVNTPNDIYVSVIASGVPGTPMAAWGLAMGGSLTTEEIRSLVAFIRGWESVAVDVVPTPYAPNAAAGAALFTQGCAICHRETPLSADKSLENLQNVITHGRPAKGMPAFGGVLSENQLADLSALFEAWLRGETVTPIFNVGSVLAAAQFALGEADAQSAQIHLQNAAAVSSGATLELIDKILRFLQAGDIASAQSALDTLASQWPIGDPLNGGTLYATHCATCHGENGEGDEGVALQPNEFVQTHSNTELHDLLLAGRPGTAMVGFGNRLNESELADVIAFMRGWNP